MLLIDILNTLNFAGVDFLPAIEAASKRRQSLAPVLRRVLTYAAEEPAAFACRFSQSMLDAAAYLLAEWADPAFLTLAQPLLAAGDHPNIFGCCSSDATRLIAKATWQRVQELPAWVVDERSDREFGMEIIQAMPVIVAWFPEKREEVYGALRSLLRHPQLGMLAGSVKSQLVEACCRLDPHDFLLDLHIAAVRGYIHDRAVRRVAASRNSLAGACLEEDGGNGPIRPHEPFLSNNWSIFHAHEFGLEVPLTEAERRALDAFNSIAAPCRDFEARFAALLSEAGVDRIARHVVLLAAYDPATYLSRHYPIALSAAICLGSPGGDPQMGAALADLLLESEAHLGSLLGDDLSEMVEWAFALAGRAVPDRVHQVIEDPDAYICARSVALGALRRQVQLGFAERDGVAQYGLELLAKRRGLRSEPWFWSDVAQLGAELEVAQMLPLLLETEREGAFIDAKGTLWATAEDLKAMFAHPAPVSDERGFRTVDAIALLGMCGKCGYMPVSDFLGRLEPPDAGT